MLKGLPSGNGDLFLLVATASVVHSLCHRDGIEPLVRPLGYRLNCDRSGALRKTMEKGLPPLPKEAKNFSEISFRQQQKALESERVVLLPETGASSWGNLSGPYYNRIKLLLAKISFREGA